MRRSLGKLSHPAIVPTSRKALFLSSPFDFSTSAEDGGDNGGAGGRGRGRGSDFSKYSFVDSTPGKSEPKSSGEETSSPPPLGHGRGKPSNIPQFTSFGAPSGNRGTIMGPGRGVVPPPASEENLESRTRISFRKEGEAILPPKVPGQSENQEKSTLPPTILSVLSGAGRGQPTQATSHSANEKVVDVNRHVKPRQPVGREPPPASPKMSKEEAINKARSILSRGGDGGVEDGGGGGQGSIGMGIRDGGGSQGYRGMGTRDGSGSQGFRGMGTRDSGGRGQWGGRGGRGSGRGRGRGQGRGRGMSYRDDDDNEEDEEDTEVDKANAEKLEKHLGLKKMDILVQAFEEACAKVFPSPEEDAHVDAMHTNLLLECEPEYLMAEFDSNPDIDENPPIALRDALEKMKPFLMSYENIQTDKEWQDVVEETMKNVPLMKELVDFYGGPNKVTAKKQGLELERVAKTLPASAPTSVKHFTDRAVLSLQSNPGWGFDKKCQFMDKLVWEVSQSYK